MVKIGAHVFYYAANFTIATGTLQVDEKMDFVIVGYESSRSNIIYYCFSRSNANDFNTSSNY